MARLKVISTPVEHHPDAVIDRTVRIRVYEGINAFNSSFFFFSQDSQVVKKNIILGHIISLLLYVF